MGRGKERLAPLTLEQRPFTSSVDPFGLVRPKYVEGKASLSPTTIIRLAPSPSSAQARIPGATMHITRRTHGHALGDVDREGTLLIALKVIVFTRAGAMRR